jgi:hypothetical protein
MFSETDFKLMGLWLQVLTRNTTLNLTSQEKPDPVGRKKAPHPTGMVELLCDQIETTMGHCNLSHWLNDIFTSLRLTPSPSAEAMESCTLGLSVRDQIGSCFKSTPRVLLVQWVLNPSKTHEKSPVHKIVQIGRNLLKKFGKVNTEFLQY